MTQIRAARQSDFGQSFLRRSSSFAPRGCPGYTPLVQGTSANRDYSVITSQGLGMLFLPRMDLGVTSSRLLCTIEAYMAHQPVTYFVRKPGKQSGTQQ